MGWTMGWTSSRMGRPAARWAPAAPPRRRAAAVGSPVVAPPPSRAWLCVPRPSATKPKGHCRLIHWGFEEGGDCPVGQCTWEALPKQKAPLDVDEFVGKDIHIKCSSRWYFASVESHVHVEGDMLSYYDNHYCKLIHCCRLTLSHLLFGTKG